MPRRHSGAIGQPRDSLSPGLRRRRPPDRQSGQPYGGRVGPEAIQDEEGQSSAVVLRTLDGDAYEGAEVELVTWQPWSDLVRRAHARAAERARRVALSRTLGRTSVRWCAIRGRMEGYYPRP